MFQTNFLEQIKTHVLFSITFSKILPFYEKMWKNMVQPNRPQMTIRRMRSACWIPKTTSIHSEYVIRIASLLQQWLHESDSMLRNTYMV
jgi:hypothetical protein